ncbi:MAG: hypothetical protein KGV56_01285 [Gammaproteobacteria bacterium]|nr:hypothetical protein [Gammaproteobacteria bacterium]
MAVIPYEAIAYLKQKKLKTAYNWSEVYANEHNAAFTVAKVMEQDILDTLHQSVIKAVESGQTFHSFKRDLINTLGKDGWGNFKQKDEKTGEIITRLSDRRLKKIYETNTRQSYHVGAWEGFQQSKNSLPYLRYRLGTSVNHRDEHRAWKDIVLPIDDPFWDTHMPMNGWGCKCWVQNISKKNAEKIGISESPKIEYHDWHNKQTGRTHKVPKGIHPSFEYNVGKYRKEKQLAFVAQKMEAVAQHSPDRAAKTIHRLVSSNVFKQWLDKPQGYFPVALLAEKTAQKIQAKTRIVRLSADTMLKQVQHHPELTVSDYRSIFYLSDIKLIKQQNENRVLIVYLQGEYYQAVIKTTKQADEVYLLSLVKLSEKRYQRLMRNVN